MASGLQVKKKRGPRGKKISENSISLMCKWRWKLEAEDGPWQEFMRKKYLREKSICNISSKAKDSPGWTDMLKLKQIYLKGRMMMIGNGKTTDIWGMPSADLILCR